MKYFIYSFLIFNFLIINSQFLVAQESRTALAIKHKLQTPDINWSNSKLKRFDATIDGKQLKNGALVVVLRTQSKRIKQLEILSRSTEISEKQRIALKAKIRATQAESERINTALMTNFDLNYDFSDIYYVYDSSLTNLRNGVKSGIFVDEFKAVDEDITLTTDNFYICNYTLVSASNESEGLVIYNSKMERMKHPFPAVSVSGSSGFNALMQLLTDDDTYQNRAISKDIEKLQRNLDSLIKKGEKEFRKP